MMKADDIRALAGDLNAAGEISDRDMEQYINVVLDSLGVHLDRERLRHGLWKQYPAEDQMRNVVHKSDRVQAILRDLHIKHYEGLEHREQESKDAALEELYDIINYSIFTVRILTGEI